MKLRKSSLILVSLTLAFAIMLSACVKGSERPQKEDTFLTIRLTDQTLSQGHRFNLEISLENNRIHNRDVESIVLPGTFVEAVNLLGTQPAMPRTINSDGDWVFEFKRTIAPQGIEKVIFSFETVSRGRFDGKGEVITKERVEVFELHLSVVGVNPMGWKPGAAKPAPSAVSEVPAHSSVVKVEAIAEVNNQRMMVWSGNGTIISPDGLILTSADLVLSDRYFQISELIVSLTVDPEAAPVPTYQAAIVQADLDLGLAVIKPHATIAGKTLDYAMLDLPAIPLGDSMLLDYGEELRVLAYSGIKDESLLQESKLFVNDFGAEFPFGEKVLIHASQAVPAGKNGAPVLNEAGELVAVPIHKSPLTFDPNTADCKALVDGNRDGRIDDLDPCHRVSLPIDTLRPVHVALPMIDAARRGEVKVLSTGHNEGLQQAPGILAGLDDFSDNHSKWKVEKSQSGEQSLLGGMYFFRLNEHNTRLWSKVDFAYGDMLVETDLRVLEGTGAGEIGLLCGVNGEDMTVFAISENAYFAIWKMQGEQMRYLREWRYSPVIDTRSPLRLSARCNAEALELAVNGTVLARLVDPDFVPGLTGLYAASAEKAGLLVGFDNFSVSIPE